MCDNKKLPQTLEVSSAWVSLGNFCRGSWIKALLGKKKKQNKEGAAKQRKPAEIADSGWNNTAVSTVCAAVQPQNSMFHLAETTGFQHLGAPVLVRLETTTSVPPLAKPTIPNVLQKWVFAAQEVSRKALNHFLQVLVHGTQVCLISTGSSLPATLDPARRTAWGCQGHCRFSRPSFQLIRLEGHRCSSFVQAHKKTIVQASFFQVTILPPFC